MKVKQSVDYKETLEVTMTLEELEALFRQETLNMLDHFKLDSSWSDHGSLPLCGDVTLIFVKSRQENGVELG